ncbi:hypothetical protein MJO28_014757 [Puccinia striiformis f. sp. tritici]|uniref:Uncharacterized protein n=3 Tax=Puccinia striiformis TaxID=27350 RepID=A0A0L0VST0_9BASI|nr:hypothetical protein Pst134EB_027646 [Puccinia striiformis f. sp. tritici]KAI7939178.1 hypothetical protein MJO28_014757 [Puccinia striiformis f. sp. tritici]KNF02267.1 hypothetical protein PSTG_04476 [Puccinia striiformis f. sp. tritici PST-78]POW03202.1 hypothetical protein PSHT_11761 [Puccinia striiformis]
MFHTGSNTQEPQHQTPPDVLVFEVGHTSNGVLISSGVFLFEDVPTFKSGRATCDFTCSSGMNSIGELSSVGGLTPNVQLDPNHNELARKRKEHESIPKAVSHLVLARKKTKGLEDNAKNVLHVDHPGEPPKSTQSNQSNEREAAEDRKNIRFLIVETLLHQSDAKIQFGNYPFFKEIVDPRRHEP